MKTQNSKLKSQKCTNLLTTYYLLLTTREAFTIIEFLIVMAIMFVFFTLVVAGYTDMSRRQRFISSGQTMKEIIRDAQSRAVNGEMDCSSLACDCSPNKTSLLGWYVDFSTHEIYGECKDAVDSVVKTFTKPFEVTSDIAITPYITPPTRLGFTYYPPGAIDKATICLTSTEVSGKYYIIRVSKAGQITDGGGLVDSCNPN